MESTTITINNKCEQPLHHFMLTSTTETGVESPVVLYYTPTLENNSTSIEVSHPRGVALRIQYHIEERGLFKRRFIDFTLFKPTDPIKFTFTPREVTGTTEATLTEENSISYARNCFDLIKPVPGAFNIFGQIVPREGE